MANYNAQRERKLEINRIFIPQPKKKIIPENNIPVFIRKGLTVFVNDESKIEAIKLKYADK